MRRLISLVFVVSTFAAGCSGGDGGGGGNKAPTADAGADQTVDTGEIVGLSGTGVDPDDEDILSYEWAFDSLPAGSEAILLNADSRTPSFVADVEGDYTLQLVVSDSDKMSADVVLVSAVGSIPVNGYPTADAGLDGTAPVNGQFANEPGSALLDASASTDPEGDYVFYFWAVTGKPQGSVALIDDPSLAQPSLLVDKDGQYEVSVWVSDDGLTFVGPDTAVIDAAGASAAALISGDAQMQTVATTLLQPLTVEVTNEFQDVIAGIAVFYDVAAGAGGDSTGAGVDFTEVDGRATGEWTLGTVTGARTVTATAVRWFDDLGNAETLLAGVDFDAMATSGPAVDFLFENDSLVSVDDGAVVRATGFDAFGNAALDDDTTEVTLNVTGNALFANAASVGTLLSGDSTNQAVIRVAMGQVEILVNNTIPESIVSYVEAQAYTLDAGPFEFPSSSANNPVLSFSFPVDIFPVGSGTLALTGRGNFGSGSGVNVYLNDNGAFSYLGYQFSNGLSCSAQPTVELAGIADFDLQSAAQDGHVDFMIENNDFDTAPCPFNDLTAQLVFPGTVGGQIDFMPGAATQVALDAPIDVIAGNAMTLSARVIDQYGNTVTNDDATRFSIALTGTNALFAASANNGLVVAGGTSDKVFLRVQNGAASIDVNNADVELVTYSLGDPVPASVAATDIEDGQFTGFPDKVVLVSGDAQTGTAGFALGMPVVLRVTDSADHTIPGIGISVSVTTGGGNVFAPVTDANGESAATYTLGGTAGPNGFTASVSGSVDVDVTATGVVGAPAIVMLLQPPAPVAGATTVRIEVQDAFGNLVPNDGSTQFSVSVNGVDSRWTALQQGTASTGLGSQVVLVTDSSGVVELTLSDIGSETVEVDHYDSIGNGLDYQSAGQITVFSTNLEADDGGFFGQDFSLGGTTWARGTPTEVAGLPPPSGANVFATGLNSSYLTFTYDCLIQSFSVQDGDVLRFEARWKLAPGDTIDFYQDEPNTGFVQDQFSGDNGSYQTITRTIDGTGTATYYFCVADNGDGFEDDGAFVDDWSITRAAPVTVVFP